jgi:hypothetical protein
MMQAGVRGPFKIGYVKGDRDSVERRRQDLQIGCPQELVVRAVAPGDVAIESLLHRYFAAQRIGGEWFHLPEDPFEAVRPVSDLTLIVWIYDAMLSEVGYSTPWPDPEPMEQAA